MRVLPSYIGPDTKSNAERKLFALLQILDVSDSAVCLHSLNLPEHLYKSASELDFVIILPEGVFVLEVKGGAVSFHDGIWHYQNRWGITERNSEGPFKQGRSGMYSMIQRLERDFDIPDFGQIVFGHGVVFPDCQFDTKSIEWDHRIVLDNRRFTQGGLREYLISLSKYWHEKFSSKPVHLASSIIREVQKALRPDFEMVPTLQSHAGYVESQLERLTQEQYERMDMLQHCPRILVEGGAGTGKTFLAAEVARRHAHSNQKVLFVCFSPILASFLRGRINLPNVAVYPLHQLMLEYVKKYTKVPEGYVPGLPISSTWFTDVLAPAFGEAIKLTSESDKFDVLILDEGQDILNLSYLSALDTLVKGGLESGTWRIFFDPNTQSGIYSTLEPGVLDLLKSFGPVPPRLTKNCRNTSPIVLQTYLLTSADLKAEGAGPGPDVTINFYDNNADAALLIEKILHELQKQQVPAGDITILSPLSWANSSIRGLKPHLLSKIKALKGSILDTFPDSRTTFSTISDFKGLENRFIILIDVEDLDSTSLAVSNLYVGMTRARVKLWLNLHSPLRKRQQEITVNNIQNMNKRIAK